MPNKKSAKKSLKQSERNRLANKSKLSRIKTERKKFLKHISNNEMELAQSAFRTTQSLIAKATKTHLFHWKKSARLISRMANKFPKEN